MSDASRIVQDLDVHAGLFDLSGSLGAELLDIAAADVCQSFDREEDPEQTPWPALSTKYQEWKDHAYPGQPIGVLHRELRPNLIGDRRLSETAAELDIGATELAKDEADWMIQGDPLNNRPPRLLGTLSTEGIARSDAVCDRHFREGTQ